MGCASLTKMNVYEHIHVLKCNIIFNYWIFNSNNKIDKHIKEQVVLNKFWIKTMVAFFQKSKSFDFYIEGLKVFLKLITFKVLFFIILYA